MNADAVLIDDKTALVLVDLQNGIVCRETAPHDAISVVEASRRLAEAFRAKRLPVVLVTVGWSSDMGDAPRQRYAMPIVAPEDPAWFATVHSALGAAETDIHVRKHQWGVFHGTDLDVQLRRRGIQTIVLAGIATNMGVEPTARHGNMAISSSLRRTPPRASGPKCMPLHSRPFSHDWAWYAASMRLSSRCGQVSRACQLSFRN